MSLFIDANKVRSVMISGRWYDVRAKTLDVDAFELINKTGPTSFDFELLHGGGEHGTCATGIGFTTTSGAKIWAPVTAIEALSDKPQTGVVK